MNCYSDSSGSISVSVSGGLGTYIYNWSNGDSTSTVSNLSANTYILNVIDSVGCIVTDTFNVDQPLPLIYNLTSSDITFSALMMVLQRFRSVEVLCLILSIGLVHQIIFQIIQHLIVY